MSYTATCANPDCTELGKPKTGLGDPPADDVVRCGACGQDCTLTDIPDEREDQRQ